MAVFKKDLKASQPHPQSKKPTVVMNTGKGSNQQPMRSSNNLDGAVGGNYGKNQQPQVPAIGTGDWTGSIG